MNYEVFYAKAQGWRNNFIKTSFRRFFNTEMSTCIFFERAVFKKWKDRRRAFCLKTPVPSSLHFLFSSAHQDEEREVSEMYIVCMCLIFLRESDRME